MQQPLIVVDYENVFLLHMIPSPKVVRVSSRGPEPERWSSADVSAALFPASPDRFVSVRRVARKAPRSFCHARQAVFAYFESMPDRASSWASLSSTTATRSCALDPPAHAARSQPFRNRRLWMHEVVE